MKNMAENKPNVANKARSPTHLSRSCNPQWLQVIAMGDKHENV
jgi:hypothetical protein